MAERNTPLDKEPVEVLLAEDNPGDVRLTRDALRGGKIRMNLNVVGDGEEALAFLRQEGQFSQALRPALVLLDLNMPKKDGYEVLQEIRKDPELECIPVVVFTSSEAKDDILRCYRYRANAYVSKPTYVEQFTNAVRLIEEFWFRVAQLPPHGGGRKLSV